MARYRTIKPELFSDGNLSDCCRDARFLFVGLLPFVDDMGRRRYSAKQLKNEVFPGDTDIDAQKVGYWFQQLVKAGVVELYEIGTIRWFRLPNFLRHQRIQHPTHTDSPPSPTENGAPRCLCDLCRKGVPAGTMGGVLRNHENTGRFVTQTEREREVVEKEREGECEREKSNTYARNEKLESQWAANGQAETNAENRRTQRRALDEIAMRMLRLLGVSDNQLMFETLTRSIEIKSRSKSCTLEAAAQQIAARAAFVAKESTPENWVQWFEDVRYEYVPQGDTRLRDRRIEARPVCGSDRCSEGWEKVKVGDVSVLRRCPDCVRLWSDLGV